MCAIRNNQIAVNGYNLVSDFKEESSEQVDEPLVPGIWIHTM